MGRALLHLVQAGVYAAIAAELSRRWPVDAALLGVAAAAQLAALPRFPRWERWLHLAAVACVLTVYGRYAAVALHVWRVFGPLTGAQAMELLGASVLALPWVLAFPLVRLFAPRAPAGPGSAPDRPDEAATAAATRARLLLPLALLPALDGLRPPPTLPGADLSAPLAAALWTRWAGGDAPLPPLPAGARVRVTALRSGEPQPSRTLDGGALADALPAGPGPGPRDALLVAVATEALPLGLLRPGTDAPASADAPVPPLAARAARRLEVLPGSFLPAAGGPTLRWRTMLASADGVVPLDHGWTAAPAGTDDTPTAADIDAALRDAAAHLARGQGADGRFTYIVRGPSGLPGAGYNYPRHAGAAWFLARVAAALDDPTARAAADAALAHLATQTRRTDDGRAHVLDPARTDGRAWIGTTALALLAHTTPGRGPLSEADDALARAYLRQVAASVDADGKVRGDLTLADGSFADQPANAYGQGQAMLALAAAERAGLNEGRAALDRALAWVERGAYAGSAHPAVVGDEHWICLAATAVREVRGVAAGAGVCDAYVADARWSAPVRGGGLVPPAGPGGGAAEALVARAWDTDRGDLRAAAFAWARVFLAARYRPGDAPLLVRPEALLGGFRDGVGDLDVQIDSVQHIGGALLGVEALLSGRARPGSLP